jgi:predicted dehydrogenase
MTIPRTVGIGLAGSGFVSDFYMAGLADVPGVEVVANYSRSAERAKEFGDRHGISRQYTSVEELSGDPEVELVVVGLPNHLHLDATRAIASAGKAIVCTKPLARNADEAAEMVRLVRDAGVMSGYAETEVFAPNVTKARQMIESGAIGKVLSVRAREGHSGPHASHFWDAEIAGGGALLDMGPHTIEVARYLFGKETRVLEAFAWGATLSHGDRTTGEDNAVALVRFDNGGISVSETSWSLKGGMELRNEITGTEGRLVTDSSASTIWGFVGESAGYTVEKADSDTGWVMPVPEEARTYGYTAEMRHFVECFREGTRPRETFSDGYVVNCALDACYRSMRSGRWEPIEIDPDLARS